MAKIKIENVPEVATISKLLGVDSNNKWAKINGGAYSTPADVAEAIKPVKQSADNAVAAANAAMNTANAAKATADGIAGTANDAKTAAKEAKVDANEAKKKADILYGMARSIYEVPLEESQDYSVSALWFCNGLADPTSTKPPTSLTGAYGTIVCFPGNSAEVKLRLLALAEIPDDTTAEFECITNAAKLTLYAGTTELGYFTRSDGEAAFAYSCKIVNRGIFHIYAMAGCTFTATYSGNSYAMLVSVGGGGSATVDSALSKTSENPVQNKAIAEAMELKAPLSSPAFKGVPTVPTPMFIIPDNNKQAVNAEMLKVMAGGGDVTFASTSMTWQFNNQILLKNSEIARVTITANIPINKEIISGKYYTAHAVAYEVEELLFRFKFIINSTVGYSTKETMITGLDLTKTYFITLHAMGVQDDNLITGLTISEINIF